MSKEIKFGDYAVAIKNYKGVMCDEVVKVNYVDDNYFGIDGYRAKYPKDMFEFYDYKNIPKEVI